MESGLPSNPPKGRRNPDTCFDSKSRATSILADDWSYWVEARARFGQRGMAHEEERVYSRRPQACRGFQRRIPHPRDLWSATVGTPGPTSCNSAHTYGLQKREGV